MIYEISYNTVFTECVGLVTDLDPLESALPPSPPAPHKRLDTAAYINDMENICDRLRYAEFTMATGDDLGDLDPDDSVLPPSPSSPIKPLDARAYFYDMDNLCDRLHTANFTSATAVNMDDLCSAFSLLCVF